MEDLLNFTIRKYAGTMAVDTTYSVDLGSKIWDDSTVENIIQVWVVC